MYLYIKYKVVHRNHDNHFRITHSPAARQLYEFVRGIINVVISVSLIYMAIKVRQLERDEDLCL